MKTKTIFTCQSCGSQAPKWLGRCPDCGNWNSFLEENFIQATVNTKDAGVSYNTDPVKIGDIECIKDKRISTKSVELDRVLGGGIVPGSVTLLAGDPGIGKSTLSLGLAYSLACSGHKVLYISGEESLKQVKLRADRLFFQGVDKALVPKGIDNLLLLNQVDLTGICESIKNISPVFVIIDSIQVVNSADIASGSGTVSQVRECAALLTALAKSLGIAVFLIGHVTKEGSIAGPRVLEHIVDTVLYFEGERYSTYKILRAVKNRFGSTNEIGVFEMGPSGLKEVADPSQIFLSERPKDVSGSVVVPTIEGTRPLLVEIQALVSKCNFGFAQRRAGGIDSNRLSLLVAVLEKRMGFNLGAEDIFLNVAGGINIDDPACDLGIIIAITSSFKNKEVPFNIVALGEVGLAADVRSVSFVDIRIKEAEKLGFKKCILPQSNFKAQASLQKNSAIEYVPVSTIKDALCVCFA